MDHRQISKYIIECQAVVSDMKRLKQREWREIMGGRVAVSHTVVREGCFEGVRCVMVWEKGFPRGGNSKCKGPEVVIN